jgi:hypothetical protein
MNRSLATAFPALCAALLFPASAAPSTMLKGPGIIRITSRETRFTRVDTGAAGRTPGDMEISRLLLYNTRIRQRPIGHGQLVCVYTGDNFRNCDGTFVLPAGKLVVSGGLIYRSLYDLAVTGGTGLYSNARGTLIVTRVRQKPPPGDVLIFRLVVS